VTAPEVAAIFAAFARLNPNVTDPATLARVFDAYAATVPLVALEARAWSYPFELEANA
jgi:hypothetical protein